MTDHTFIHDEEIRIFSDRYGIDFEVLHHGARKKWSFREEPCDSLRMSQGLASCFLWMDKWKAKDSPVEGDGNGGR